jgi:hypothetical protein
VKVKSRFIPEKNNLIIIIATVIIGRSDQTLQDVIFKVVPGLQQSK